MADVTTKVCDLDGEPDATSVVIKEYRRKEFIIDLCPACYEPINRFRDAGRTPQGSRTYRRYKKMQYEERPEQPV